MFSNVRYSRFSYFTASKDRRSFAWNNVLASSTFAISVVPSSDPIVSSRINYYLLSGVLVVARRKQSVKSCHPGNEGSNEKTTPSPRFQPLKQRQPASRCNNGRRCRDGCRLSASILHGCARRNDLLAVSWLGWCTIQPWFVRVIAYAR